MKKLMVNAVLIIVSFGSLFSSPGDLLLTLTGHNKEVHDVKFFPNGNYCISTSQDSTARLWNLKTGVSEWTMIGHNNDVTSVSISYDNKYALTTSMDRTVKYWDLTKRSLIYTFTDHTDAVWDCDISPDGVYALTGGNWYDSIRYWDLVKGICLQLILERRSPVYGIRWERNNQPRMITGSYDWGHVCYWNTQSWNKIWDSGDLQGQINDVDISPSGEYVLSVSYASAVNDRVTRCWRTSNGNVEWSFVAHNPSNTTAARFSPSGNEFLTSGEDNVARYWNFSTRTQLLLLNSHTDAINEIDISKDSHYALTASKDKTVKYWALDNYTSFNDNKSASHIPTKSFTASPNPFSSRLSVSLPSSGAVYSITGRLIMKLPKGNHSLDTSKWREGVYIVKAGKECKKVVKVE
ncbi:MAG: hypothetical protein JXA60_12220 [Candidatus Coatesbacteria bacterium]|nr:hypothetical protein [Candidatus Coatesbacteria bacterium]